MADVIYDVKEGHVFTIDATLVAVECSTCKMTYAIPESLHRSMLRWRGDRADGKGWKICCPMGHAWWYVGEHEADMLKRDLEYERSRRARLASERDQLQSSLRAQRGATTRARNQRDHARQQQAQGECPCCGKEFKVLAKHMKRMHPDFPGDVDDDRVTTG